MDKQKKSQGKYLHYKGKPYDVLGEARDVSTQIVYIIYRQDYSNKRWWIRPKNMFFDQIVAGGVPQERFSKLEKEMNIPTVKNRTFSVTHTETGEKYKAKYTAFLDQYLLVLEGQNGEQLELELITSKESKEEGD